MGNFERSAGATQMIIMGITILFQSFGCLLLQSCSKGKEAEMSAPDESPCVMRESNIEPVVETCSPRGRMTVTFISPTHSDHTLPGLSGMLLRDVDVAEPAASFSPLSWCGGSPFQRHPSWTYTIHQKSNDNGLREAHKEVLSSPYSRQSDCEHGKTRRQSPSDERKG